MTDDERRRRIDEAKRLLDEDDIKPAWMDVLVVVFLAGTAVAMLWRIIEAMT